MLRKSPQTSLSRGAVLAACKHIGKQEEQANGIKFAYIDTGNIPRGKSQEQEPNTLILYTLNLGSFVVTVIHVDGL